MGSKSDASQPAAPDPTTVDAAQTAANDQTAQYQQQLNMINTNGPNGSVSYIPSSAPGGYTQQTTLSPAQQGLYNSTTQAEQGALNIGNQQLGNVSNALSQTVTPGALQSSVNANPIQSSYDPGGSLAYGYNPGGSVQGAVSSGAPIQASYGSGGQIQNQVTGQGANPGAVQNAGQAAYNTATQYLTPQYQQANEQLQSQLAAQGLNPNDAAYQNAVTLQNNQQNQGYQGAINAATTAGDAEQNTLYNQNLSSGQFTNSAQLQGNTENATAMTNYNAAQNQGYNQGLSSANFANTAQAQQNTENAAQASMNNAAQSTANTENANAATFANTAQNQGFTQGQANAALGNSAEGQLFSQQAYGQSLPINELSSLLGLSQVSQPTAISYSPTSVGQTNALGAYQLNSQVGENNYNTALSQQNDVLGGLFGLGSSVLKANPSLVGGI